jgi:hypothetical protein
MILTLLSHAHEEDEKEEYDDDSCGSDMSLHPFKMQLQNKISWPYLWITLYLPTGSGHSQ